MRLIIAIILGIVGYFVWTIMTSDPSSVEVGTLPVHEFPYKTYRTMAAAKKNKKVIVLVFTADWCPPCKYMVSEVYRSQAVKSISDFYTWVVIDTDSPEGKRLSLQYEVASIPTFIVMNTSEKILGRISGSRSPDEFVDFLMTAKAKNL